MQEWEEAGLYDPAAPAAADRLALLDYLTGLGFGLADLVSAHAEGRVLALAGDRLMRQAGRDLDAAAVAELLGDDATLGLARVVGAALARSAEAANSALWTGDADIGLEASGSELVTARAWAEVAAVVPAYGQLLTVVHRHHISDVRRYVESLPRPPSRAVRRAVGFADVSGFTTLSQEVDLSHLSQLLSAFEEVGTQVVREHGGRVVKFLGDAVMFVTADASHLVEVARALIDTPRALSTGLLVRAGGAAGDVLAQDGDYFGTPVNLASRLTHAAQPRELLVDATIAGELAPGAAVALDPVALRGFTEPVTPYRVG